MGNLLVQAGHLIPALIAANAVLSAVGGLAAAIAKMKGSSNKVADLIGSISGYVKKAIDLLSANLPHE